MTKHKIINGQVFQEEGFFLLEPFISPKTELYQRKSIMLHQEKKLSQTLPMDM